MNNQTAKQIAGILVMSVFIIVFSSLWSTLFTEIFQAYQWISSYATSIFSDGPTGTLIRRTVISTLFPLAVAGIPAGIYWMIKRQLMPYFYHLVWLLWIVVMTITLIRH